MDREEYAAELFGDFIFTRTYSRFRWNDLRRETWEETVDRYCDYLFSKTKNADKIPEKVHKKVKNYIYNKGLAPSMRFLWSAGPNVDRDNIAIYNCAAVAVDCLEVFGEVMYVLLAGAGCGVGLEQKSVSKLPVIVKQQNKEPLRFTIPDSRLGWKEAIDIGVKTWYEGRDIQFDYSQIRPAGSPLMVSGGYASGGGPLQRALEFIRETIIQSQGRKLKSIELFDIITEIGSSVVCGGVRRSSILALISEEDYEMRNAKRGTFHPRRYLANISIAYHSKPKVLDFVEDFLDMAKSNTGEPGLVNFVAAKKRALRRRNKSMISLVNPCSEVFLTSAEFCNLVEVIITASDDFDSVRDKCISAAWTATCQSTFDYMPHLRDIWRQNCETERLIGVSLTGICDNPSIVTAEALKYWKKTVDKTAKQAAEVLGINVPAALCCVKPSGTVSSLVNSSAGMHSRFASYYLRRVRISTHDALFKTMIEQGMPHTMDKGNHDTAIFTFPMKSPKGSILRSDETALDQLKRYQLLVNNWADMNVSCTIQVKDEEWLNIFNYVYSNWDSISGITFFPYDNTFYQDAPYEEITEEEYLKRVDELPKIDFSLLSQYEVTDTTIGQREYACSGGSCEIV